MPSVTRTPPGRRSPGREQLERRLLDATERLMRDGASFTELSVDRLAGAAGISRASFYIYFEDKGHLLRRLASRVFGELTDSARRWLECGRAAQPRRRAGGDDPHHRHLSPASGGAGGAQRDVRLRPPDGADLPRDTDRHLRPAHPGHRRRSGRRVDPPAAGRDHHRERVDLDGRAGLPGRTYRPSRPPTTRSWPTRWQKSFGAHCISRPPRGTDHTAPLTPPPGHRRAPRACAARRAAHWSSVPSWSPVRWRRRPPRRGPPAPPPARAVPRRRQRRTGRTPR